MGTDLKVYKPEYVPLHGGGEIACVADLEPGSYGVAFSYTCEAMGLDYRMEHRRLKKHHWATISLREMVARDGKVRKMAFLDRKTFTMWLATIDAYLIKDDDVRRTVELYQAQAADVLDRYFSGARTAADSPTPALSPGAAAILEALASIVQGQAPSPAPLAIPEAEAPRRRKGRPTRGNALPLDKKSQVGGRVPRRPLDAFWAWLISVQNDGRFEVLGAKLNAEVMLGLFLIDWESRTIAEREGFVQKLIPAYEAAVLHESATRRRIASQARGRKQLA